MAVTPGKITVRIGRLVAGDNAADAAMTAAALRGELARLIAEAGMCEARSAGAACAAHRDGGVLQAATPAGRGREAASRIMVSLK